MLVELIVAILLALAVWAWHDIKIARHRKKEKIDSAFTDREPLTTAQLHVRYFERQGIPLHIVDGVIAILSEHLAADLSRLTAEDDFSKNLRFFWDFDSMADVEIVCALEKKFGIKISDQEGEDAHTLNDLIHLVASKALVQIAQSESAPAD